MPEQTTLQEAPPSLVDPEIVPPPPQPAASNGSAPASIDWPARQRPLVRRLLNGLERISLAVEKPVVRLVRDPQFNPLYHTGTITLFALLVILVTGVYLTMFFQFGFAESYGAVARIETSLVGRIIRALHRYASGLALIAALLHGWRTFFMDRFRGPRWLAWVTGIVLAALVWAAGVTGYWLIFDERAQVLNQTLVNLLDGFSGGVAFLNRYLVTTAAGTGWLLVAVILGVHLGLSLLIGIGFYIHIKRLKRAKVLPPRFWIAAVAGVLVVAAVLAPAGMLPPADPSRLPGRMPIDLFFLAYLPGALHLTPSLFWGGATVLLVLLAAIPWLLLRKPLKPVVVHEDLCTGCTLCVADCPYKAIALVERPEGSAHKYLAVVDPKRCVSCGVCIGSCAPLALTLGDRPAEPLWQQTIAAAARRSPQPVRVVFTCERHAAHGGRPYLPQPERRFFGVKNGWQQGAVVDGVHVEVIPLTCIGMAHPDLASRALAAGAAEVQFVGCPPEDCANREGNLWVQERLERQRLPKLRREAIGAAVSSDWLAPNDFLRALRSSGQQTTATAYGSGVGAGGVGSMLPAVLLLAGVLLVQILLTNVPYRPFGAEEAVVRIAMTHRSGYPVEHAQAGQTQEAAPPPGVAAPIRLILEVDGQAVLNKSYPLGDEATAPVQVLEQVQLPAGDHHLRLLMADRIDRAALQVLVDQHTTLAGGQALAFEIKDARLAADPEAGRKLFTQSSVGASAGCQICHSLQPDVKLVGPSLAGVSTRAAERVPGLPAEAYLRQAIVDPDAYVVEGFPAGEMPPNFSEMLSKQQIDDLVAFLMTLK